MLQSPTNAMVNSPTAVNRNSLIPTISIASINERDSPMCQSKEDRSLSPSMLAVTSKDSKRRSVNLDKEE